MTRRLYLYKNKKLTGVCGGIAECFGFEPAIVRIITVLLTLLFKWPVVIIYILLWIVMPSGQD